MAQPQVQDDELDQAPPAPGTEGTEYEGMTESEVERAMFDKEVDDDPDLEDGPEAKPPVVVKDDPPVEDPPDTPPAAKDEPPAKAEEPPPEPTGFEWIDDLSEEGQAHVKEFMGRSSETIARLDQRVRSHLGQLQPAQRTIAALSGKLREAEGKLVKQQPSAINLEDRIKDFGKWADEEYKEFPEEAAKLKTQFAESLDGVSQVLETATPQIQPTTVAGPDQREEVQHLATAYSDWGERRYSPEFGQWIATQQPAMKSLLNSPYAADNVALLDAFTRDNPYWAPPQTPDTFHSLAQAQHSPLYRGWAEGEGINPDMNLAQVADYDRDAILSRFKNDLGAEIAELDVEQGDPPVSKLAERRAAQLQNRDPGSTRRGVKPGDKIDLNTEEGQRAYFDQLIAADPDLK